MEIRRALRHDRELRQWIRYTTLDPFKGGELDSLEVSPWSAPVDHLGLVETVDGFGERIVVGISDTADRRLYACFSQALGVFD